MGIFKEMKSLADDSPTQIEQARQMATTAHWRSARRVHPASDFEPIANVTLEIYAQISKSLATIDYDLSQSIRLATAKGISEENWTSAVAGWNARMAVNPAVGSRFSALYASS